MNYEYEDLAHYDEATLPILIKPLNIEQGDTKKYLGNRYIKGSITASFSYVAKTKDEINALYEFYATECEYGNKPFILELDILGLSETNKFVFTWITRFTAKNETGIARTGNITLEAKYKINSENELVEI